MDQNQFMMAGGMPPQGMQRPQPGNENDQILAKVMDELRKKPIPSGSWHVTVDTRERATWIMQIQSILRQMPNQNNDPLQAVRIALRFEAHQFNQSATKEQYVSSVRQKLMDFHRACQQQAINTNNMPPPQQNNFQMPQTVQGGMGVNMQGGMGMSIPMQPTRSTQGDMTQQQQQQFQQPFQQPAMNAPTQSTPMQPNITQQQRLMAMMTEQEKQLVQQQAQHLMAKLPKQQADQLRAQAWAALPPEKRQPNQDPLPRHLHQMAMNNYLKSKLAQQQSQSNPQSLGLDVQQQQQNQNMQRPQTQQAMNPAQSIDFASFAGQQADALKSQESGQLVVPASTNAAGNTTAAPPASTATTMDPSALNMAAMNQSGMMNNQVQAMLAQRQQQLQRDAAMRNSNLQAQAQAQTQARNQAQQAAQQAAQQQNMLRGQPGGLNNTQAPQQSPAMSMLNRPMVPPGQQGMPTPQQGQQLLPQANGQLNPQLLAQMQQQQQQHQQNMNNNQTMFNQPKSGLQIPDGIPLALKNKLQSMPEEQARIFLQRFIQQQQQKQQQQQQQQQQIQQAQQAPQLQGLANGLNMSTAGNMNNLQNLQQPGQPVPNMANMVGMNQPQTQAQIQQRMAQQQQHVARMRAIDNAEFPRDILQELGLPAPDTIRTWHDLKQFIQGNVSTLAPDTMQKVQRYQSAMAMRLAKQGHFNTNANVLNAGQMPGQHPATAPGPGMMPGAQAPPAQMVPPQAAMNQPQQPRLNMPMNQPNLAMMQPTPQEMQIFRVKTNNPNAPDEQVRKAIMNMKMAKLQQDNPVAFQQHNQQLQQQAMRQGQANRAKQANQGQQPLGMPVQPAGLQQRPQPLLNMPAATPKTQGQKRPGTSEDVVEIPNPNQSPQRPPTASAQNLAQMPRPSIETLRTMTPEQLATMPQEQKQQLSMHLQHKQQMEALKRAQGQAQPGQAALPPSQMQQRPPFQVTQEHREAANRAMMQSDMTVKKGGPYNITDGSFPSTVAKLTQMLPLINQLEKAIPYAVALAQRGEIGEADVVKTLCMLRTSFLQQMDKTGAVQGYVSLPLDKLEELDNRIRKTVGFVMHRLQLATKAAAQPQARPQPQGEAQLSMQATTAAQVPQKPQQIPQPQKPQQPQPTQTQAQAQAGPKGAIARNGSTSGPRPKNKAPPAPTSTNPPFPLGAPSPHGVPFYEGMSTGLTSDKLQLPPQKKRKGNVGSAASTPVNAGNTPNGASPQLTKTQQSPEHKRQMLKQLEMQQQQQQERRFKCEDEYCEFNIRGFEKEEELQAHTAEAHKKVEDPLSFFLTSAADALDLDADGNAKATKADSQAANRGKQATPAIKTQTLGPATIKREALKADGQTPGTLKPVATPSSTFIKPSSPASGRTPHTKPTQQQQKQVEAATAPAKKTMLESMAEKAGIPLPPKEDTAEATKTANTSPIVGEDATGRDDSLSFMYNISDALSGLDNPYGDNDMDFSFSDPSPALTPSSSQSGLTDSTASSLTNISEHDRMKMSLEWDPFNLGSGIKMPTFGLDLGLEDVGLTSHFDSRTTPTQQTHDQQQKQGADIKLSDQSTEKQTVGGLEMGANMGLESMMALPDADSYSGPMTWDTLFGAGAGLDRDDTNWDKDAFGNSVFAGSEFFSSAV